MYIDKRKKYAIFFVLILILTFSYIKIYSLYDKYDEDKENITDFLVVVQNLGEDENKVKYLVKFNSDSFILNIYKEDKFNKSLNKIDHSSYIYGDELEVIGKISKPELYGNPR